MGIKSTNSFEALQEDCGKEGDEKSDGGIQKEGLSDKEKVMENPSSKQKEQGGAHSVNKVVTSTAPEQPNKVDTATGGTPQ